MNEEAEYVKLKLQYVQSVNTVFRQKVTSLLRELIAQRVDVGSSMVSQVMSELENQSESDAHELCWRDKFLDSLEDSRPASLRDAQTLCTLLQERSDLQLTVQKLQLELEASRSECVKMSSAFSQLLDDRTVGAEDALVQRYRQKELELVRLNPDAGTTFAVAEAEALRAEILNGEQKLKLLRLRCEKSRREVETARIEVSHIHETYAKQLADLVEIVNELKAQAALREADCRRAESDRATAMRTVTLKDQTISRLDAQIAALQKEVAAALKEESANITTNESSILRRQIDSFELIIRQLERKLSERQHRCDELEKEVCTLRDTIVAKQVVIDSKNRLSEILSKRIEAMNVEAHNKDMAMDTMRHLETRITAAILEVSGRQNPSDLLSKVSAMCDSIAEFQSVQRALEAKSDALVVSQTEIVALRDELQKCMKFNRVPSLELFESERVRQILSHPKAGEVVLRRSGTWTELRDVSSGTTIYTTTDVTCTPFDIVTIQQTGAVSTTMEPDEAFGGGDAIAMPTLPDRVETPRAASPNSDSELASPF